MLNSKFKSRLSALEQAIGVDEDRIKAIFVSVIDGRRGAVERDDEAECIGLEANHRGQVLRVDRQIGETLASLQERATLLFNDFQGVPIWRLLYAEGAQ